MDEGTTALSKVRELSVIEGYGLMRNPFEAKMRRKKKAVR